MMALELNSQKFKLGQVVMTQGISAETITNPEFSKEVAICLIRHASGDFSDMESEEDIKLNTEAIETGERILSAYQTCQGKIWIITEWDRSATTILFPEEY